MFGWHLIKENDSRRDGDSRSMKIKCGHNKIEDEYYVSITDRRTLETYRYYFHTVEEFTNFCKFGLFVDATTRAQKQKGNL